MDSSLQPHALLVPGPGLGHINGSMLLAKALVSAGFSITFVYFARTFATHSKSNRLPTPHPAIRLEIVPDGRPGGLPSYLDLFTVTPAMHEGLEQLVRKLSIEQPICCIISDTFMFWTQDVADKFEIPRVDYWTTTATSYLFLLSLRELLSKGYIGPQGDTLDGKTDDPEFVDCILGIPRFPVDEIASDFRTPDSVDTVIKPFLPIESYTKRASRVLIHSLNELESNGFKGLAEAQIPAYAIGPLIQYDSFVSKHGKDLGPAPPRDECISWLDTQANCSVIYVSFGSNAPLSPEEVMELAIGLEASGQPFLWVIRSDVVKGEELSSMLPEGFESRTKGRGTIVFWAPQVAVLEHEAVGGFLTHCGWNSTCESLWVGVPMLACPRRAEQKTNARFIANEWGVGILLGGTKEGILRNRDVQEGVEALMIGKIGQQAREKAQELKDIVRKAAAQGGSSHTNLLMFAEEMRNRQSNLTHKPCLTISSQQS